MDTQQKIAYLSYLTQFVTRERHTKIKTVLAARTRHITIAMQDVSNSQNVAAIMRTCEAMGLQEIAAIELESSIDIKTNVARGAVQWMELKRYRKQDHPNPTKACIDALKANGYRIIATSPHATRLISELPLDAKVAFLLGTENTGLTEDAFALADETIALPQCGFVESLNVAVSAALCVYDFTLRLRSSSLIWQLAPEEQLNLEIAWMERSLERPELMKELFLTEQTHLTTKK